MAKKRKASARNSGAHESLNFDKQAGKVAITTYEDVADSEDEFHIQRDKVMLDEGPDAKRRRKWEDEDAQLAPSDEEVLGYSESDDDQDEEPAPKSRSKSSQKAASSGDESEAQEEEEEERWGASRKDYYNADEIQTEADALEEEAEAKRLQQKKLQKMTEADFGFDESEWLENGKQGDKEDVVVEVLKDVEITYQMGREERLRILRSRYPEFEFLADEFVALQPIWQDLQKEDEGEAMVVKSRALAAYMASLTMYFAILTSSTPRALDPTELRDHPVMESLLQCRTLWNKVKSLKGPSPIPNSESELEEESDPSPKETITKVIPSASDSDYDSSPESKPSNLQDTLAELDSLLPSRKTKKSSSKPTHKTLTSYSSDSDFGEAPHLSKSEVLAKSTRKKTLKFYTSQITQKANKRLGAGNNAGGDDDLPYRERLRDRQARLNAEAEKRGKILDAAGRGTALGGKDDADSGSEAEVPREQDQDDEYYNLISRTSSSKKASKAAAIAASKLAAENSALDRVAVDADEEGKRAIGYTIEKNKGLAPKRKKEVRNPRVKKRMKFEEKKKKLGSMKAIYKGGEERGGYGGEKTGIKSGLVKSIKL